MPELLLPAGNMSNLRTAIAFGADAVYVGAAGFSMRPDSASFGLEELAEAIEFVHEHGKKIYVALNSLIHEDEIGSVAQWLEQTSDLAFDAIIIADMCMLELIKKYQPNRDIHISTQLSCANSLSAKFYCQSGAKRVVLARETPLENVRKIANTGCDVEIFVHGAMCSAVSGRCLLSAHFTGMSASRGQCKHTCRWPWLIAKVTDPKRPNLPMEIVQTEKETIFLGSADLCLIGHLNDVVASGAVSLKIEGRMKNEHYIAVVTKCYREALDSLAKCEDFSSWQVDPKWVDMLETLTHHPYSTGFAFSYPTDEPALLQSSGRILQKHEIVGIVRSVDSANSEIIIEAKAPIRIDNEPICFIAPRHDGEIVVEAITDNATSEPLEKTHCAELVRLKISSVIPSDKEPPCKRSSAECLSESITPLTVLRMPAKP
jgi:U32 family peptidase